MGESRRAGGTGREAGNAVGWGPHNPGSSGQYRKFLESGERTRYKRTLADPGVGERFGQLTASGHVVRRANGQYVAEVQCDCGAPAHWAALHNLRKGATTRCNPCAKKATAAYRKKWLSYASYMPDQAHRTRLLNRLSSAIGRCHNPKARQFPHYGGRGIAVWPEWRENRGSFLLYIQTLPGWDDPDLEMDREDCDKGYEPGNIRFVTRRENSLNKRQMAEREQQLRDLRNRVADLEACLRSCKCGAAQEVHDSDGLGASACP